MKAISLLFAGLAVLPLAGLLFSLQISECNLKVDTPAAQRILHDFAFSFFWRGMFTRVLAIAKAMALDFLKSHTSMQVDQFTV